jgi:hypothetical protein
LAIMLFLRMYLMATLWRVFMGMWQLLWERLTLSPSWKNLLVKQKNLVPNSRPVSSESWTSHWVWPLHSCEIWRSHQRCLIQVLLWQMETAEAITTTAQLCLQVSSTH